MGYNTTPVRTFPNNATLEADRRVMLSGGYLVYAGVNDEELGTLEFRVTSDDPYASVRVRNATGTALFVAAGAISAGATFYAAANGKVAATGFRQRGIAMEATSADGDSFEGFRLENLPVAAASVAAAGSTQSDATALTGPINTVSAADGTKGVVLPTAVAGTVVRVYNEHATNGLKIYPASGDDINDGTTDAAVTIEGKTLATFIALDATTWAATFTANT